MNRLRMSMIVILLLPGCGGEGSDQVKITTTDEAKTQLRPVSPPQRLIFDVSRRDEASAEEGAVKRMEEGSETGRFTENLPFAPLIAMDPITGEKLSIERETPTTEYDDRIFYFSSEENKQIFLADPEEYTKGRFARY